MKKQFYLIVLGVLFFNFSYAQEKNYGNIVWYTLVTPNLSESETFYENLFGWDIKNFTVKGKSIALVFSNNAPIGSMIEVPNANASLWLATLSVKNLDSVVKSFTENGGSVIMNTFNIQNSGKQVIVQGPEKEKFGFIEKKALKVSDLSNEEGSWIWTELWSDHAEKSVSFYEKAFGLNIEKTTSDNKPYWLMKNGTKKMGGIIKNPLNGASTQWVPYIKITDVNSFYTKLKSTKAYVILPPNPKVRNGKVIIFEDPHGATLCIQNYTKH